MMFASITPTPNHNFVLNQIKCRGLESGKYLTFLIPHTTDAVQTAWKMCFSELEKLGYLFDKSRPIMERYRKNFCRQALLWIVCSYSTIWIWTIILSRALQILSCKTICKAGTRKKTWKIPGRKSRQPLICLGFFPLKALFSARAVTARPERFRQGLCISALVLLHMVRIVGTVPVFCCILIHGTIHDSASFRCCQLPSFTISSRTLIRSCNVSRCTLRSRMQFFRSTERVSNLSRIFGET